jgi:hypothetical protein
VLFIQDGRDICWPAHKSPGILAGVFSGM